MGAAAATMNRRLIVAVSGTNFTVQDSGLAGLPGGMNSAVSTALAGAGTQTLPLFTLNAGAVILACKIKPTIAFTGGAVTVTTVEIGYANATDTFFARFNIFNAVADTQVRHKVQIGQTIKGQVAALNNGAGNITVVGAAGDNVLALVGAGPAAGWTAAGSEQAAGTSPLVPGRGFESSLATANVLVQTDATDLSAFSGIMLSTDLQPAALESTGTVINALFRTTTANVNALTAGSMEIDLLIWDAPLTAVGVG